MAKPTYDKPPVTISEQLDILEEKGMVITDMAFARHALETIGYYRFTGYAYTFRDQADNSSYLEGTTFEQVMNLYEFDRELKQILFGYIERIEVAFRAKVIDVMSVGYGNGQWFADDSLFFNSVEHQEFLNKMTLTVRWKSSCAISVKSMLTSFHQHGLLCRYAPLDDLSNSIRT